MKLRTQLLFGALCALFLFSCKDTILTEDKLLNADDNLNVVFRDDLKITAYTEADTPLLGRNLSVQMLGSMGDPIFGKTYASFYTNFRLPTNNVDLGTGLTIDSVVLFFPIKGRYGKFSQPAEWIVYELNEGLDATQNYLNNRSFMVKLPELGRHYYTPTITDTAVRIRLNNSFGQNLINQSGTDNMANTSAFQSFFKGIYISPNASVPGDGVFDLDLISGGAKMSLYYHPGTDTTRTYNLYLDDQCTRVNHYYNNLSGTTAQTALNSPSAGGDQKIYLQGLTSTRGRIKIHGLDTLTNLAVNKAELWVFPLLSDSTFNFPYRLYLARVDDEGHDVALVDFTIESNIGGLLSSVSLSGVTVPFYKLNITRYAQSIMNHEFNNNGLRLYIFPTNVTAERVVVGGGNHPSLPIKLRLISTKTQ